MNYSEIIDCKWLGRSWAPILMALVLTGCADAELPERPYAHVTVDMTLLAGVPHYEVKYETSPELEVDKITIMQIHNINSPMIRDTKRSLFNVMLSNPGTYIDEGCQAYAGDMITYFAYIHTEMGNTKSEEHTITVPSAPAVVIDDVSFSFDQPTGNKGTLRIYGQNITTQTGAITLEGSDNGIYTKNAQLKFYPDSIIASNVECRTYGTNRLNLSYHWNTIPLEVNVEGVQIDSVSPMNFKIGEPFTIYYSHTTPEVNYKAGFNLYGFKQETQILSQDEHHICLLPTVYNSQNLSSISNFVSITDTQRNITVFSKDSITITRDSWGSWGNAATSHNCRVGNRLCSFFDDIFTSFNLDNYRTDIWKRVKPAGEDNEVDNRMFGIADRYAYVWYYFNASWVPDSAYLSRYDLSESKWENLTAYNRMVGKVWFEDDNTFRGVQGSILYTYHVDTNTWDTPTSTHKSKNKEGVMLNEDCQFCGTYQNYVYFVLSSSVYRYPVGDPTEIEFVGRPKYPISIAYMIYDDTFYFATKGFDGASHFLFIYKMPMSSLLEGTNEITYVGCPQGVRSYNRTHFYETNDYYIITLDGEIMNLKK